MMRPEDIGIQDILAVDVQWVFRRTIWLFTVLSFFLSEGLYVWIFLVVSFHCVVKKEYEALFTSIYVAAVILSILVTTPAFSKFRYAYCVFSSLPYYCRRIL